MMVSYEGDCAGRQYEVVVADDATVDSKEPVGPVDNRFAVPSPAP